MFPITITIHNAAQLTAVLRAFATPLDPQAQAAPSAQPEVPKPAPEAKAPQEPAQELKKEPKPAKAAKEPKVEEEPKKVTYEAVAALVSKVAGRDRKKALAMLQKHDLTTLKDATPSQYAAIHATFAAAGLDS